MIKILICMHLKTQNNNLKTFECALRYILNFLLEIYKIDQFFAKNMIRFKMY